ncbi:serine hydrolase domain-containing protein [Thalassococcus lentus]|uniref:Serine hydrolase n=1 Tax=Thalassococcus lentus TaxID=1210524 RepID=A0ABT4XMS1_9RHOB|nr:serine hydrolase [Thalassococcus lentus]MDA7423235.1 serine hydrolase [Thalassococcus lentus]
MTRFNIRSFSKRRTATTFAAVTLASVLVIWAGLWIFAPQILVLRKEGFPGPIWPAPGEFSTVDGLAFQPIPETQLPLDAARLFAQSKGRALLVAQGDRPVRALYGDGIDPETRLNSYSLVKTLVAALTIRAMADGLIPDLDVPLQTVLGPDTPDVSLRDVLSMTSGLALGYEPPKDEKQAAMDDQSFSPFSPVAKLQAFGIDPLMRRIRIEPAYQGHFHYQSANTALLGRAIERLYNRPVQDVLSDLIWKPAGASDAYWRNVPDTEIASAWCCLYARPADWLRVGQFLLNNGGDTPFLPAALHQAFLFPDLDPETRSAGHYGWHVRHDVLDRPGQQVQGPFTYLMGHGGQVVYLVPSENAVVVRFGDEPQLLHSTLYSILSQ